MPKISYKKPLPEEKARAIAKKRASKTKVRLGKNAIGPLGAELVGTLARNNGTAATESVNIGPSVFASAFELAGAERDATERMMAAAQSDPVESDGELIVHVDGVVSLIARDRIVQFLLHGDQKDEEWPFRDDLYFATYYAPLFWACIHYAGGAKAVREHDCSVTRAAIMELVESPERRAELLRRR